jgi:hypothetical protein
MAQYIIKKGDNLSTIAKKNGVKLKDLLSINKINSWLNNTPFIVKSSSNNNYSRVSSFENIDFDNIKIIENRTLEDKKLIDDVFVVVNRVKHGYYSQLIKEDTSDEILSTLKNSINDMISSTEQNFIQVNNILEEYVKYNYREELKLDGIEKGGVFEALINNINQLRSAINDMLKKDKLNGLILDKSSNELLINVDKLNNYLINVAATNVSIRRKIVIIRRFLIELINKY